MPDTETVALPDGRTLAYAEYGAEFGHPVLCCHGNPGSRKLGRLFDEAHYSALVRNREAILRAAVE